MKPDYPINSEELTRHLGFNKERDRKSYDHALQMLVRPALRGFGCPKDGSHLRSQWIIDRAMAERVASYLGLQLR